MPRRGKSTDDVTRLALAVDAIARRCWRGLPALLGRVAAPTSAQISDALRAAGVDADPAFILAEWSNIVEAVQEIARTFPEDWTLYADFIRLKETGRASWGGVSIAERLAENRSLSTTGVYALVRSIPRRIAAQVSMLS